MLKEYSFISKILIFVIIIYTIYLNWHYVDEIKRRPFPLREIFQAGGSFVTDKRLRQIEEISTERLVGFLGENKDNPDKYFFDYFQAQYLCVPSVLVEDGIEYRYILISADEPASLIEGLEELDLKLVREIDPGLFLFEISDYSK